MAVMAEATERSARFLADGQAAEARGVLLSEAVIGALESLERYGDGLMQDPMKKRALRN